MREWEMRRRIAWMLAIFSGFYLLTIGVLPDPLPFLDEGVALLIFVRSMAYLGHDVKRLIPFLGKSKGLNKAGRAGHARRTVDV